MHWAGENTSCMVATATRMDCSRQGFCDLVVEADMKPYDYLALVPIVEGAGGVMTDWKVRGFQWHPPSYGHHMRITTTAIC